MTTQWKRLAGLTLAAALAVPAGRAAEPGRASNEIRAVEVADAGGGLELTIRGTRPPSFTVFRLQDPPRLVVDLAGADVTGVAPQSVNRGGVLQVTTAQYRDERSSVGRVIIGIDPAARYEVAPRGETLVVKVGAPAPTLPARTATTPTPAATTPAPSATTPPTAPTPAPPARATPPTSKPATDATPAAPADHVVSRRVDAADVRQTANAVKGVRSGRDGLTIALDGQVARFEILELDSPPRLALDLYGVSRAPRQTVALDGPFARARFGRDAGKVRVVLDASGPLPRFEVRRVPDGLAVAASPAPAGARGADAGPASAGPDRKIPAAPAGARAGDAGPASAGPDRKIPAGAAAAAGEPREPASARLAVAPQPRPAEAKPVVIGDAAIRDAAAAGFASEAPTYALSGAPQRREYTGRRITLEFHDIEIRNLLRLIADVSRRNIVVADDVQGKVTVSLRNVPWDQALDLILKTKQLDKEEVGNVIRVAKFEDIAKEQEARAKAAQARIPLIPLKVRLIPVNFARAQDLQSRVKDVLSERGSVTVDDRTNVLIVKDIQEALARAEGLVRNLDTAIPQVRIESRIVEASSNFSKQIGIQWGGNVNFGPATGNPTGLFFPSVAGATGGAGQAPNAGTAATPNYAVNLPAAVGQGQGGALGFVFGSAGGAFNLNLRISALENTGVLKTISAPSVSTVDNKEATISQGLSIPFSQASQQGTNTQFVEAKLELKVTPHVSADGSILMKIKVTNNQPNPQLTGANGQPSISKREAETEALVRDGETTVIGGIYTRQTSNRSNEVPVLAKIPILGYFFRAKTESDDHTELLIFITPRILHRQTAVAAGQ